MTTRHPKPAPAPTDVTGLLKSLLLKSLSDQVGQTSSGGSSSTGDLYGLGPWGSQKVNPGDLPFIGGIIGKGKETKGDEIVKAFASLGGKHSPLNTAALAEIQRAMYLGGFYSSTKHVPQYGVLSADDVSAFGQAVILAGKSGGSVSELLLQRAKYGTQAGIQAAYSARVSASAKASPQVAEVQQRYATGTLEALANEAFEKVVGHKASEKDKAEFASLYRSMVVGVERGNIAAQQQAIQQGALGGLSASEAGTFEQRLADVGKPRDQQVGGTPTDHTPWWGAVVDGLMGNNHDGMNAPAYTAHDVPVSFGEQLGELQTLGQAVTAASAARTPAMGGGSPQIIDHEEPVNPSVAAENFARNQHPHQAARTDIGSSFGMFLRLLAGNGGA